MSVPSTHSSNSPVATAGLGLLLLLAISSLAARFLINTESEWNDVRTVISYALAYGHSIYHSANEGPLWSNIYPPLGYLLYTPVALGQTPLQAIRIGQLLSAAFYLFPLLIVLLAVSRRIRHVLPPLVLGLSLTSALSPLNSVALLVHIDAPAVGLGLVSLWLVVRYFSSRWLVLAAHVALASVLCKQTMAALPVATVAFLFVVHGRRPAITYLVGLVIAVATLVLPLVLVFGPRELYYQSFVVPSRQPFWGPLREILPEVTLAATKEIWPLLMLLPLPLWRAVATKHTSARHLLIITLLTALLQLPLAYLGAIKFGGALNNLTLALYFFLAAILTAFADLLHQRPNGARALAVSLLAASLILCFPAVNLYRRNPIPLSQHTMAFAALKAHPNQLYFPWNPLAHLMVDGRLTHQAWGVLDRKAAGETLPADYVRRYLPPSFTTIALSRPPQENAAVWSYLGNNYTHQIHVPGLEGWWCLQQASR